MKAIKPPKQPNPKPLFSSVARVFYSAFSAYMDRDKVKSFRRNFNMGAVIRDFYNKAYRVAEGGNLIRLNEIGL